MQETDLGICECCNKEDAVYEIKCKWEDRPYKVCISCSKDLVCCQLSKSGFKNLISNGHNCEEFLLHGDYYDDDGNMMQPECGVNLHIARWMMKTGQLNESSINDVVNVPPVEKKNITKKKLNDYFKAKYEVITVVPACENPEIYKYILTFDELQQLEEDLLQCGEFIADVKLIKE
jgi:hypothetical protein